MFSAYMLACTSPRCKGWSQTKIAASIETKMKNRTNVTIQR